MIILNTDARDITTVENVNSTLPDIFEIETIEASKNAKAIKDMP
jgi:hypothetical protein